MRRPSAECGGFFRRAEKPRNSLAEAASDGRETPMDGHSKGTHFVLRTQPNRQTILGNVKSTQIGVILNSIQKSLSLKCYGTVECKEYLIK